MGGSRPQPVQETDEMEQSRPSEDEMEIHPAVSLGQHIRRERGMEGVRGYVVALREYLPPTEYQEVCRAMGVPTDLQPQQRHTPAPPQPAQEAPVPQNNANNQMQMMQMLQMLMAMQNGGIGAMGGNMGGQPVMGNNAGGGINPMMLAQLAGMNGMGGQSGGINPMMLAQLLGGMPK